MAGSPSNIIVVAQAATPEAAPPGVVTAPAVEPAAPAAEHGAAETHEGTVAHEGEAHGAFPPFDGATFGGQLLWLAITFTALYFVMSRVALPRIGSILETRRTRIEGDLKEAERLRQETEKAAAAYEAALAEARRNAQVIAEETRQSIKADIDNRRADVEAGLTARVTEAETRIAATKTAAMTNVGQIATDTAQALVERLTGSVGIKDVRDAVALAGKE